MFLEKEMTTQSVLLPGKSHGWRSLAGCSPWGHKESDTTECLHFTSPCFIFIMTKLWEKKYQKSLATLRSTVDSCCIGFADSIKWGWLQGARVGGGGGRTGSQEVCNFIDLPTWPRWDPSPGTVRKGTSAISLRAFLFCLEVNYFPFGKLVNIKRWLEWRDWTMQIRDW